MSVPASVVVFSNRPDRVGPIQASLLPTPSEWFDGTGAVSFSWCINQIVSRAQSERVIITSDKCMPTTAQVLRVHELLDDGFGAVHLARLAFMGFEKELFRRIGCFDELFVGGGFEDVDWVRRIKEADIALYEKERECPYTLETSTWLHRNVRRLYEKWDRETTGAPRLIPEPPCPYDWGPPTGRKYRPWADSVLIPKIYPGWEFMAQ